ncbi:MAG: hypothetical protein H8E44_12520, partial [Planctomycetes bacterium]|nr:hypothetical protein [Planctomycetota bacterium]
MAWTTYHDALMQEYISLVTEPAWYDQATITTRLTEIRTELADAGATITADDSIDELIAEFERAKEDAQEANEERYAQLITEASGTIDATLVMSYPQIAKHMKDAYWTPLTTEHTDLQSDQSDRDETVVDHWVSAWDTVADMFDTVLNYADELATDQQFRDQEVIEDLDSVWTTLAATYDAISTSSAELEVEQQALDQAIVDQWDAVWSELNTRFDDIGSQARIDIQEAFQNQKASLQQSMIDRGVYNSGLLDSMTVGLAKEEAAELRRFDESYGLQKIQAQQMVLVSQVQALAQQAQNQMQLNQQTLQIAGQKAAVQQTVETTQTQLLGQQAQNRMQLAQQTLQLGAQKAGVQQAIETMQTQLLGQQSQNRMVWDQQRSQVKAGTVDARQSLLSAEGQMLVQKATNQMQLKLQEVAHRSQAAMELQKIFAATLDAVQARTDIAPSLS